MGRCVSDQEQRLVGVGVLAPGNTLDRIVERLIRALGPAAPAPAQPRIDTFTSEVDPFALSLLDSGHFVVWRNLWLDALIENIRDKIASQAHAAGFTLNLACSGEAGAAVVQADRDLVAQILINLADNAVKFSAKVEHQAIDLACDLQRGRGVGISVRDYGPGIPKTQLRKIFQLFYRSETELTRETVGTGIGLAWCGS